MTHVNNPQRRKLPKRVAVIDPDRCTGCGACVEVCPAGCIARVEQHADAPGHLAWCEVDWDRCTGCTSCLRAPSRSEGYTLAVCPWGAIEMVALARLVEAVERMGGPPPLAESHRRRLLAVAERQAALARGAGESPGRSGIL